MFSISFCISFIRHVLWTLNFDAFLCHQFHFVCLQCIWFRFTLLSTIFLCCQNVSFFYASGFILGPFIANDLIHLVFDFFQLIVMHSFSCNRLFSFSIDTFDLNLVLFWCYWVHLHSLFRRCFSQLLYPNLILYNTAGVTIEIERYSDKYKPNFKSKRPPLSSVLKLTSAYFPAELIGAQGGICFLCISQDIVAFCGFLWLCLKFSTDRKKGQYKGTSQWTLDTNSQKTGAHFDLSCSSIIVLCRIHIHLDMDILKQEKQFS